MIPRKVLLGDEVSGFDLLAWEADGCLGRRVDALLHQWPGAVCDYGDGGYGDAAVAAVSGQGAGRWIGSAFLVLRTVSNYDQQPKGMDAATSLANQRIGQYGAYLPSLEAAYSVGHVVAGELITNWSLYREGAPGVKHSME